MRSNFAWDEITIFDVHFFLLHLCFMLMHALVFYLSIYFVIVSFTLKCRCETTGMQINNSQNCRVRRLCDQVDCAGGDWWLCALASFRDNNSINEMNAIMRNLYATKSTCIVWSRRPPQANARRNFRMEKNLVILFSSSCFPPMRYGRMNISWHRVEFNEFMPSCDILACSLQFSNSLGTCDVDSQ